MLNLVVGDVHAVPEELDDCRALIGLVADVVREKNPAMVTFMGDQHNSHDTMSTRVMAFWHEAFKTIYDAGDDHLRVVALVGNHDQASPRDQFPHAMSAYPTVTVIDRPRRLIEGVCAMPFFHDPAEFLAATQALKAENPEAETLFCHQTFVGADGGFYAKDECKATAVPFRTVFSGHIHTPQVVDKKVVYLGSPRWRTRDDAGHNRFVYLLKHTGGTTKLVEKVSTDSVCRRIWVFDDRPDAPADLDSIPEAQRKLAAIRVEVYGPEAHVKQRMLELRALGARVRGIPDRARAAKLSEADGIDKAFQRYLDSFVAPNGTTPEVLRGMLEERLTR